jgi:hypothetical protein
MEVRVTGHNFENCPHKDHPCHVCFKLADWFQRRRFLNIFAIGSYFKTMSADGGHLQSVNLKQTWHVWSLGGQLSNLCPVTLTSIQDGHLQQTYCSLRQKQKSCIWPSNEHFCQVWFKSVLWFQKKRWKCEIPIRSYVKLSQVMGMIIGWSCTKIVNRLLIGNSRWPPWLDLILT